MKSKNIKLLLVNLLDPSKSHYVAQKNLAAKLWGRSLSKTILFLVDEDNQILEQVSLEDGEVTEIKSNVESLMKRKVST